ncbi:MAG: hypothetical protein K2G52_03385 [Muribaculaceae bacterium]|nr:hypothetical protein [Muribaculaceae bacterium]
MGNSSIVSLLIFLGLNIINMTNLSDEQDESTYHEITEQKEQPDHEKKRTSGTNQNIGIYCDSYAKKCTFIIPSYISSLYVQIESNHGMMSEYVSSSNPVWDIELSRGTYYIICTSDEGRIFAGNIVI